MFINIKTYRDISEAGSACSILSESSLKDRVALLCAGGSSFAFDLRFGLWATGICQKQSANQVLLFMIIHICIFIDITSQYYHHCHVSLSVCL